MYLNFYYLQVNEVSKIFNIIVISLLAISLFDMPAAAALVNFQTQDATPCHEMASSQQWKYSGFAVYDVMKNCCDPKTKILNPSFNKLRSH